MAYGSFNSGGEALAVDATLKVSGAAADAKATGDALAGKADTNHSHAYLPLSGGVLSGNIHFADIGDNAIAPGITWAGSTDGAGIYYQTTDSDCGNLVLNLTDDSNCCLRIAKSGEFKSYFTPDDGNFHGNVNGRADFAGSADAVAWDNVTGKPPSYPPAAHSHDNWYYTKDEANRLLNSKSNTDHNHDGRYLPANGKASSAEYADSAGAANSVNGLTFAAQTTDPGAGSALVSNKVLLVYQ